MSDEDLADDEAVPTGDDVVMPLEGHLDELRTRLLRVAGFVVLASMACFAASDSILGLVTATAPGQRFIFLSPVEPIMVKLRLALLCGVGLAVPYALLEAWAFIRPGLRPAERRLSVLFVPPVLLCFAGGVALGWLVFLPVGVDFFVALAGPGLTAQFSIAAYTEFALTVLLVFGLMAELPLVLLFLGRVGLVTPETLTKHRGTVVVTIFLLAGLFTPPDWVSQVLVAIPLVLLYETGLLLVRCFGR